MPNPAAESALLTGPVKPLILRIALPSMTGMIASGLSTLFDALLLSRGSAQLAAAASLSFPLLTLIQTIGFTLGMGAGSFVSRSLGKGEKVPAIHAASTAFFSALILSGALCAAAFQASEPLVRLLGADDGNAEAAAVYARYVLASAPMLCASLVLSSLLRAQGSTRPGMIAYLLGAAVSIPMQLLLVLKLSLGVAGAGAAMLVREALTLAVLLIAVYRGKSPVRPRPGAVAFRLRVFRDIMRSGLPTLVRQGLMSLSSVLLMRQSAAFGEAALAGMGLAVRVLALISSAVIGFGQGFQPICGVNYGAGNLDRIRASYRFCLRCVFFALASVGALVFFFAGPLLSRFAQEPSAADFAAAVLRAQSVVLFAQGAVIMMNMLTQSMGLTVRAALIASSRQGFVLIPLLLLLPRFFGQTGLILCQSASDMLSLALCFLLSRSALTDSSSSRGGCWDARKASQ